MAQELGKKKCIRMLKKKKKTVPSKHIHKITVPLSVTAFSPTHQTAWEHNAYCFWLPIMMHNLVAAQEYNTNMSGL